MFACLRVFFGRAFFNTEFFGAYRFAYSDLITIEKIDIAFVDQMNRNYGRFALVRKHCNSAARVASVARIITCSLGEYSELFAVFKCFQRTSDG